MVLRLDPAIPSVWRDPRTLQFGVDPALAVLELTTRGQERLVSALTTGVTSAGFRLLAEEGEVPARQRDALLARLRPCLLPEVATAEAPAASTPAAATRAPAPIPARGAVVHGSGPLAVGIARLLDDAGFRMRDARRRPGLVVLVADRVLSAADHRAWLQRDIPHLPVVTGDASVTVGPLVVPGVSACLHCAFLHRRDADAAWPAIAAQLAALPAPAPHPLRTAAAVAHAGRLVAAFLDSAPGRSAQGHAEPGREWRIADDGSTVSERAVLPHPECRCATPPGSDWAPAGGSARPRPTSAARASAGRA